MAKLRISKNYGVAPNEVLNSKNLSFKAKGIYTYMQSKPDGWDFNASRIAKDTNDGRDKVLTGLKELEDHGYLIRRKTKDGRGKWVWEHILLESPTTDDSPSGTSPTDKATNNKERKTKKESVNDNYSGEDKSSQEIELSKKVVKVTGSFQEILGRNPKHWSIHRNQREACGRLYDEYGSLVPKALRFYKEYCDEEYFPQITSPVELEKKWLQLLAAKKRLGV